MLSTKLLGYENLYFSDQNKEFYSSINKFPPEIIETVLQLKKENEWRSLILFGEFLNKGGTLSNRLFSEIVQRGLGFDNNGHEEFTPIGKIIWNYREVLKEAKNIT